MCVALKRQKGHSVINKILTTLSQLVKYVRKHSQRRKLRVKWSLLSELVSDTTAPRRSFSTVLQGEPRQFPSAKSHRYTPG